MNWQRQTTQSYGSKQGFPPSAELKGALNFAIKRKQRYKRVCIMPSESKMRKTNGRMYSLSRFIGNPMLGRMLSPDPVVQSPGNLQNYNRYSYALNNPLKYTDPSGYVANSRIEDPWASRTADAYFHEVNRRYGGGGGGLSYFSRPGVGGNGTGLNGIYYDWNTGTYRSSSDGNSGVGWAYTENSVAGYGKSVSTLIFSGTKENPYQNLRGVHYSDKTTWYVGEGFSGNIDQSGGSVPHGGIMFYDESGSPLYVSGLGSENIIHTVSSGDISKFQKSLSALNPKSSPLTLENAQLLASVYGNSTYDIVMPGKNSVLGYSMPGWGSWFGMFASMGGEGFMTGRLNGSLQISKPKGWQGLQGHYSSSPGILGFWEHRFTSRKLQPWW